LNAGIVDPHQEKVYAVSQQLKGIVELYDSMNLDMNSCLRAVAHDW